MMNLEVAKFATCYLQDYAAGCTKISHTRRHGAHGNVVSAGMSGSAGMQMSILSGDKSTDKLLSVCPENVLVYLSPESHPIHHGLMVASALVGAVRPWL